MDIGSERWVPRGYGKRKVRIWDDKKHWKRLGADIRKWRMMAYMKAILEGASVKEAKRIAGYGSKNSHKILGKMSCEAMRRLLTFKDGDAWKDDEYSWRFT